MNWKAGVCVCVGRDHEINVCQKDITCGCKFRVYIYMLYLQGPRLQIHSYRSLVVRTKVTTLSVHKNKLSPHVLSVSLNMTLFKWLAHTQTHTHGHTDSEWISPEITLTQFYSSEEIHRFTDKLLKGTKGGLHMFLNVKLFWKPFKSTWQKKKKKKRNQRVYCSLQITEWCIHYISVPLAGRI